ncbi:MAG: hypothetical protein WC331_10570 [Candidatus Omnitrophota bacterium]|jgi:hypothetical protein
MRAYKVIHRRTRLGLNAALYIKNTGLKELLKDIDKYELELYFPTYEKGTVVKKVPNSVGIMAFETYEQAADCICAYQIERTAAIVEVKGRLCKVHAGKRVAPGVADFLLNIKTRRRAYPLNGTLFFDYVKVL